MESKAQLIWRENKQGLCDLLEGWDGEGDGRRVGWGGRWEAGSEGRGHRSTYPSYLMYNRKPQNSVKQLSFN